jgi:uncharacterized membrane protein YdbT with pleckstrin-like domain
MDQKTLKFGVSRKLYLPFYLMLVFLFALVGFIKVSDLPLNSLTIIGTTTFAIIGICFTEIHRIKDSYHITTDYLEHYSGFIAKKTNKIHIKSITDINARQKLWQRLMGYGSIIVQSASGASYIEVKNIGKPDKFIETLEKRMEEMERRA